MRFLCTNNYFDKNRHTKAVTQGIQRIIENII